MDTHQYDVVKRESDYAIYTGSTPLLSPAGHEVASKSLRLMEHIVRDLLLEDPDDQLNALTFFTAEKDLTPDEMTDKMKHCLASDPLVRRKMPQLLKNTPAPEGGGLYQSTSLNPILFFFSGLIEALHKNNTLLMDKMQGYVSEVFNDYERFQEAMLELFQQLSPARKAAAILLAEHHQCGMLLATMLANTWLTPSEYANAAICLIPPSENGNKDLAPRFLHYRMEASEAQEYVTIAPEPGDAKDTRVPELIARGEGYRLEFKSTLRRNLKSGKNDPNITYAIMKTLTAFLNSSGGDLLIGVSDDGKILGVEADEFENMDRFELHFWQAVETTLGGQCTPYIRLEHERHDTALVCVVTCEASPTPVFAQKKGGEEELFIRMGPSSRRLGMREALEFINRRFPET